MNDERLTNLEERFAWIERHVREQDKAMLEMGEELRRLRREAELLKGSLLRKDSGDESTEPDQKPPHY